VGITRPAYAGSRRTPRRHPHRFANSKTVAERLQRFSGVAATPLYRPPPFAGKLSTADRLPCVFAPSRIERHMRQILLIEAMRYVTSPVFASISGSGGQRAVDENESAALGLKRRVRLIGELDEDPLLAFCAVCFAVFFGPRGEDLGNITLEAMPRVRSPSPSVVLKNSPGAFICLSHETPHQAALIKLRSRELSFWDLIDSYRAFSQLDLSPFDLVNRFKYRAWMISHPRHAPYLLYRLRGLNLVPGEHLLVAPLIEFPCIIEQLSAASTPDLASQLSSWTTCAAP
jgi:hypothetical protein